MKKTTVDLKGHSSQCVPKGQIRKFFVIKHGDARGPNETFPEMEKLLFRQLWSALSTVLLSMEFSVIFRTVYWALRALPGTGAEEVPVVQDSQPPFRVPHGWHNVPGSNLLACRSVSDKWSMSINVIFI
jgi:hypothetical protein